MTKTIASRNPLRKSNLPSRSLRPAEMKRLNKAKTTTLSAPQAGNRGFITMPTHMPDDNSIISIHVVTRSKTSIVNNCT